MEEADETLVTAVIIISEIEYGLSRLPESSRKWDLAERFATCNTKDFTHIGIGLIKPWNRVD